ncbi:6349_t:CDS:2, partial [Gigaspora margarita]
EQISIDYSEGVRENNYEVTKIHLTDIILAINRNQILEVWRVVISCGFNNNYVAFLRCSTQARWHIGLIVAHWYKDNFTDGNNDIWQQPPITLCEVNSTRQKYGRPQDLIRKALDLAIATNAYNKAKSSVEIEDQYIKKKQRLLTEVSNQIINETDKNGNKDKRKTCQNCLQKGHNKTICKLAKAG